MHTARYAREVYIRILKNSTEVLIFKNAKNQSKCIV